jgi:hypothetical protein
MPIGELLKRQETCRGAEINLQLRRLDLCYFVFMGNWKDLKKVLDALSDPESLTLRDVSNREQHDVILSNVVRRLHNLVASVMTLIDHSRLVLRALDMNGALKGKYRVRVGKDFGTPEHTFVQELRNYVLHYRLPPVVDTINWQVGDSPGQGTLDMGVALDAKKLLEWGGWNPSEREFVVSHRGGQVPLNQVLQRYFETNQGFYRWFLGELKALHRDALTEFDQVSEEIAGRLAGRKSGTAERSADDDRDSDCRARRYCSGS